jgi:hypothetical protein
MYYRRHCRTARRMFIKYVCITVLAVRLQDYLDVEATWTEQLVLGPTPNTIPPQTGRTPSRQREAKGRRWRSMRSLAIVSCGMSFQTSVSGVVAFPRQRQLRRAPLC